MLDPAVPEVDPQGDLHIAGIVRFCQQMLSSISQLSGSVSGSPLLDYWLLISQ